MGLGPLYDDDDIISGINVTPLVDIALVLLIIFIATSAIIVRAAINVDLPTAATAEDAPPEYVSVLLDNSGSLYFNGEATTHAALAGQIAVEVANNPEIRALIAAGRSVDYGQVMRLIDMVRAAGVAGFSLNVDPDPDALEAPAQ